MTLNFLARTACFAVLVTGLLSGTASGHEESSDGPEGPEAPGSRWDLSLDLPMWPSLGDLQPIGGGSFDGVGFGIGMSAHWPVKKFANSELMLGIDGSIAATPSNIRGTFESLLARQLYLGGSAKWLIGDRRNLSLDAGLGYYEIDMAQVDSEWYGTLEYEHWSTSKLSGFIGATWDIGAGRPGHDGGFFVGLRVHFADLGRVYDEEFVPGRTTLGDDAGRLDGPLYLLRVGLSSR